MTVKPVRKAVLPVAGFGTRVLPATKSVPKEMLTVVDRPALQYVVDEALAAGITHIVFVTGRNKGAIEDYFDRAFELEVTLDAKRGQERSQGRPADENDRHGRKTGGRRRAVEFKNHRPLYSPARNYGAVARSGSRCRRRNSADGRYGSHDGIAELSCNPDTAPSARKSVLHCLRPKR